MKTISFILCVMLLMGCEDTHYQNGNSWMKSYYKEGMRCSYLTLALDEYNISSMNGNIDADNQIRNTMKIINGDETCKYVYNLKYKQYENNSTNYNAIVIMAVGIVSYQK